MNIQITSDDFEYKKHEKNYSLLLFRTLFILPFFKVSYIHYSHIPSRQFITHSGHMHKNY